MTLTIHKEEDDKRQLLVKVEVPEQRVDEAMRRKARELARELRFPGFRPGKVPYRVVVQRFGRDALRAEAVDEIFPAIFSEAIDELGVEPYAQPTLDEMQLEPLVLEFTVPLEPEVTLGEYRHWRREVEPVTVTEEALKAALENVQVAHQEVESVDRPIEAGDLVTVAGRGALVAAEEEEDVLGTEEQLETAAESSVEADTGAEEHPNEIIFEEESLDLLMDDQKLFPGTPFVENLLGLQVGEDASFTFVFPEDFDEESFAGREAAFQLSILDVKKRKLPLLDDELAKLEGDYETLEELRESLRERLLREAEGEAQEELIESTVDDLAEDAVIVYPPAVVDAEIDDMVESFKQQVKRGGWELEDYLKLTATTEERLREDFRENAEKRLQRRLILRAFILQEKLRVEAEDVEGLVEERIGRFDNEEFRQQMHDFYMQGPGFDLLSSEVLSGKVYERIKAILAGEAPDLQTLVDEETADIEEE